MGLHDLLDLSLVLCLHGPHDSVGVGVSFLLVVSAPLLQLLQSELELALRLKQVTLVVVLLGFKEHHLPFPECLVTIVVALQVL